MATSGSVDFAHTRTQLIESALRKCGVLREGISATADQLTVGALALNPILKALQTMGMPLWAIKEGAVFPINDVNTVSLGPSGGHAATTWAQTQLATAEALDSTSLGVDSITGFTNGDFIGIELDSGNMHWTTINGVPAGTTIVITTGLATAAAVDRNVYGYTTKTVRPLKIIQAQRFNYNTSTTTEVPVNIVSRDEFLRISSKTTEGQPNQIWYDPQLVRGILNFYPRFQNGDEIIKIYFQRPFEDMDAAGDTLDFPQEFENYIVWELAATLAPENGVPERKFGMILQKAAYEKSLVEAFGQEEGSIFLVPETRDR